MDHFGIGVGVAGAANVFFQSGRRTGRTTSLVESVKDGDRVVFTSQREARRVKSLCKDRGVDIEIVVCDPKDPSRLFGRGSPSGDVRTIFDHGWVEQFYINAIGRAAGEIDHFQRKLSGHGEPHRPTQQQMQARRKWEQ